MNMQWYIQVQYFDAMNVCNSKYTPLHTVHILWLPPCCQIIQAWDLKAHPLKQIEKDQKYREIDPLPSLQNKNGNGTQPMTKLFFGTKGTVVHTNMR